MVLNDADLVARVPFRRSDSQKPCGNSGCFLLAFTGLFILPKGHERTIIYIIYIVDIYIYSVDVYVQYAYIHDTDTTYRHNHIYPQLIGL